MIHIINMAAMVLLKHCHHSVIGELNGSCRIYLYRMNATAIRFLKHKQKINLFTSLLVYSVLQLFQYAVLIDVGSSFLDHSIKILICLFQQLCSYGTLSVTKKCRTLEMKGYGSLRIRQLRQPSFNTILYLLLRTCYKRKILF